MVRQRLSSVSCAWMIATAVAGCTPHGVMPPPLFDLSDDPVSPSWCVGEETPKINLCSFDGCEPNEQSTYLLEVARRPQAAVTAMVGVQVLGVAASDDIGNLDLRFTDDQGFELCARERRHLSTLCRETGEYVLEFVELYFNPEPPAQSWDGIEGTLSAEIELKGESLRTELSARIVALETP